MAYRSDLLGCRWLAQADVLVQYLKDYAKPQEDAGKMQYNTKVVEIARQGPDDPFTLALVGPTGAATARCMVVVNAAGGWVRSARCGPSQ